jgi:hypothetical protein
MTTEISELVNKFKIVYDKKTGKIILFVKPTPEIAKEVTERKQEIVAYILVEDEKKMKALNEELSKIKIEPNIDDYDMEDPIISMKYWSDRRKYYETLPKESKKSDIKSLSEMTEEEKKEYWEKINNL